MTKKLIEALTSAVQTKENFETWQDFVNQVIEIEGEADTPQRVAIGLNTNRIEIDANNLTLISSINNLRVSLLELKLALEFIEYLREVIPPIEEGGLIIPEDGGGAIIDDTVTVTDKTWSSNKIQSGLNTKQPTGNYVLTTDTRLSDARTPTGAAGGDLTSTYPNPTLAALSIGSIGSNFLASVSVDSKGRVTGINPYNPIKEGFQFHHFIGAADLFNVTGTGSIAGSYGVGTAAHPGIYIVNCQPVSGSPNPSSFCAQKGAFNAIILGAAIWRFRAIIRIPTLSTGSDTFSAFWGLLDSSGASAPQNGCMFVHDNTRGLWCRNSSGGTNTEASSGVSMVAGNWYDCVIEINKAANSVVYSVNGSVVQTLTTNIPTGNISYGFHSYKASGQPTTSRGIEADFYSLYWNFN
ncbi:MAG: hypothetical protein KME30_17235 [Iphinoe sp. HA4291-MV1]|jgi:hypothetical protein|nr:hypothetical protein [Iphinoe sp. HA4291-MV1]